MGATTAEVPADVVKLTETAAEAGQAQSAR
jgi:hypothetical protein